MRLVDRIANFFNQRQYLLYLLLFVITANLFAYLQLDPTFADPDSFYHAKAALLLAEKGAITEFPWLSATTLKYNFVDHHFLYHLILIPFVKLFPPLVGLKVATIIFASLAVLVIFWFLRQLKIKGAFWYTLFLLTINPFIFRLNLAKAQQLVLVLVFIIIYFLFNRRYLGLIFISGIYVWFYGGWPLILLLIVIYGVIHWFWAAKQQGWLALNLGRLKACGQNFLLFISAGLGILAGLFFNPYFPKNLNFYWQQSFKIAVLNYQHLIGVGGEWYPYQFSDLLLAAAPLFLLFILALVIFIVSLEKQSMNSWFFLILSFLFFALTLKSRRYVEYFVPLAVCFSALSLNASLNSIKAFFVKLSSRQAALLAPWIILLALSPVFYRDLKLIKDSYQTGFAFDRFSEPMEWLKQNSAPGEIVFHSDWDEFPILFYHNDQNYYLVGLDPTFMYEYDKDLYQRWVDITTGESSQNLVPTIREVFGASYIFVDINQNIDFDRNLANNFYFQQVFENQEARIYQVLE
jgi:hypothetical protein